MAAKTIPFGPLKIDPVALGGQGNAVLGIRDSGKTYTATLLAEGLFKAGIPFIAFDPIGVWRFLRVPGSGAKARGFPIVVAGGQDGDLPLTPASAPAIVEAAMANGVSLVLDLYSIDLSKADWRRIVTSCLEVLLHKNRSLRHVFIEEAAEFAPQQIRPDSGAVYAAVEKLARMGGNARLGYTLINQRAEEVNKAVLELCDNLFLHRQKGRNSLTALSKWLDIGNVAGHKAIIETLSTLPTGECWAWLAGSDTPVRTAVPLKDSLAPDRRVMRGDKGDPATAKPVDVANFVGIMRIALAQDAEISKAKDPKHLQAEVRRLTAELARKPAADPQALEVAEQAGYRRGDADGYANGIRALQPLLDLLPGFRSTLAEIEAGVKTIAAQGGPMPAPTKYPKPADRSAAPAARPAPSAPAAAGVTDSVTLTAPQKRVLEALLWWKRAGFASIDRARACLMGGWSPKASTFGVYISQLTAAGLVHVPTQGQIALTDAGEAVAPEPADMGQLLDACRAQLKGEAAAKAFDAIVAAWPNSIGRGELADQLGLSRTASTLGVYISKITSFGFATTSPGQVRAADWLFPEAN